MSRSVKLKVELDFSLGKKKSAFNMGFWNLPLKITDINHYSSPSTCLPSPVEVFAFLAL
jgi:hypothetical protein